MSDASILPGAEPPAPDAGMPLPPDFDEGGGGSGGSDTGAVPRGTPPPTLVAPSPSPSASASASPGAGKGVATGTKLPKKTHTVFARDPFKPLIAAPVAPATGVGSASVPSGSGGFTFPSGGASGGGTPTSVPASYGPPIWIELIKVGTSNAVFDVGYRGGKKFRFDVAAPDPSAVQGTVFDKEFALLGIQNGEATVQVGDATPFDLRPGVSHPV